MATRWARDAGGGAPPPGRGGGGAPAGPRGGGGGGGRGDGAHARERVVGTIAGRADDDRDRCDPAAGTGGDPLGDVEEGGHAGLVVGEVDDRDARAVAKDVQAAG